MAQGADTPTRGVSRRKGRIRLWSAGAIMLTVIASLWVGPRFIDWSPYKADVASLISEQLGVTVVLRGGLQIEILPQPRITAADIAITG
ncbi:MAG TPA: hypothetical protein DD390_11415, partial [Rhodospirillaceae bacterium]|nr:hypothetical protein [Rhodospirillaceae bacterium]